jgi:hypothetical protein
MACSVTTAYSLGCKGGVGGIRSLFLFSDIITGVTYTSGGTNNEVVSDIAGTGTLVEFQLYRGGSNFAETMAADPASGTVVYTQTITALFRDFNSQLRNQFSLLAKSGTIQAIVRTNKDEYILFGVDFDGGDATAINLASGTAYTDRQGYDVTLTFLQQNPSSFVNVTSNNLQAALTGITVTAA